MEGDTWGTQAQGPRAESAGRARAPGSVLSSERGREDIRVKLLDLILFFFKCVVVRVDTIQSAIVLTEQDLVSINYLSNRIVASV